MSTTTPSNAEKENGAEKSDLSPNRFVPIIHSFPGLLLPCIPRGPSNEEVSAIRTFAKSRAQFFCELGSGSGGHLLELATRYPQAACLGFELRFKRAYRTAEKADQQKIRNVLIAKTDARELLKIADHGSIDRIYVNFPDPWQKKKWLKHRLLAPAMLHGLCSLLKTGGLLLYKTDHLEYLATTKEVIAQIGGFKITWYSEDYRNEATMTPNDEAQPPEVIETEFERLFRSQQKPLGFLRAEKIPVPLI